MEFIWQFLLLMLVLNALAPILIPKVKGFIGEAVVSRMLKSLPAEEYIVLDNVMLKTDKGTTQIDHVVLSLYGIFVIEMKNYKGWITGTDRSRQWTQNIYGKKYSFQNPIHQNYGHVKALEQLLDEPEAHFIPMVVFSVNADLKVKTNQHVFYTANLKKKIREYNEFLYTRQKIEAFQKKITASNVDSRENRKHHVQTIQKNKQRERIQVKQGICPKCQGQLIERTGKYGTFTGCSHFPNCRYTVK